MSDSIFSSRLRLPALLSPPPLGALAFGAVASLAMACGGPGGTDTGPSSGTDAGPSTEDAGRSALSGERYYYVVSVADIARPESDTESVGFDVDGLQSDGDPTTTADRECLGGDGREGLDFTSPDGDPGIDHALAELLPAIDPFVDVMSTPEVETLEGALQRTINFGYFLLIVEVVADSLDADDAVTVNFYIGAPPADVLSPELTADRLTPGQRLDFNTGLMGGTDPLATVVGTIEDGRLVAGPGEFRLSLATDMPLSFRMLDTQIQADITPTTLSGGVLGGKLVVDELITSLRSSGVTQLVNVADLAESVLPNMADTGPADGEGNCGSITGAAIFEAVTIRPGVFRDPRADL